MPLSNATPSAPPVLRTRLTPMRKSLPFLLLLSLPTLSHAQLRTTLGSHLAAASGGGGASLVGVTVATEASGLGLRLGASIERSPQGAVASGMEIAGRGVWGADLDGMAYLRSNAGILRLVPYGLVGVGVRGSGLEGADPALFVNFGSGVRTRLLGPLHLEGEARYRSALSGDAAAGAVGSGLEFRAGASMRVGSGSAAPRAALPPRSTPPVFPPARVETGGGAAVAVARRTLDAGEGLLGTRYVWGGSSPDQGFDCSGFVQYVFRRNGVELPRVSRDQAGAGSPLPTQIEALRPGDLLFFASDGARIDHVAIYAGEGRILHASNSAGEVRYDDLRSHRGSWYVRHMVAARRVIDAEVRWSGL